MNNQNQKREGGGQNHGNLNIAIPSSITPRNQNQDNSLQSGVEDSKDEHMVEIIDDQNIKLNSPNLSSQPTQTRQAKRAEAQKQQQQQINKNAKAYNSNQVSGSGIAHDIVKSDGSVGYQEPDNVEIQKNPEGIQRRSTYGHGARSPAELEYNNDKPVDPNMLKYKFWKGKQIFILGGKIQFGINLWAPIASFVLINIISSIMIWVTISDLVLKFDFLKIFIPIGLILEVVVSIMLWVTATKDPATIPMREYLQEAYKRKIDNTTEDTLNRGKYLAVYGPFLTKMKYCPTCDIFRPPRTIHCALCGCCIERLDHHCPWIGTCVGKRNYKYFLIFIYSLLMMIIVNIIFCIIYFLNMNYKGNQANYILTVISLSITVIISIFVFYLCGYHQYILFRNETTNENLKKSYSKLGNPFQRGICDNFRRLFRKDKRNWRAEEEIVVSKQELMPLRKQTTIHRTLTKLSSSVAKSKSSRNDETELQSSNKKAANLSNLYGPNYQSNGVGAKEQQSVNKNNVEESHEFESKRSGSPTKAEDIGLGFDEFQMESVNATNNEIHAHVSRLDISGDEAIQSEADPSHRNKVLHDSEFKNSARKQIEGSNRKNR